MQRFVIVGLVLAACGTRAAPSDAGLDPETERAASSSLRALGHALALVGPLLPDAEGLRDAAAVGDTRPAQIDPGQRLAAVIAADSWITPDCASLAWSDPTATIDFDAPPDSPGCTLQASGETIDGTLELTVTFFPTTYRFALDSLVIGGRGLTGALTLNVGGDCPPGDATCVRCRDVDDACRAMRESQRTLAGTFGIAADGSLVTLGDVELGVDLRSGRVRSLGGTYTAGATPFVALEVTLHPGDCLPAEGAVAIVETTTAITLLPTTPADGFVHVAVGLGDPGRRMLFTPCPN